MSIVYDGPARYQFTQSSTAKRSSPATAASSIRRRHSPGAPGARVSLCGEIAAGMKIRRDEAKLLDGVTREDQVPVVDRIRNCRRRCRCFPPR